MPSTTPLYAPATATSPLAWRLIVTAVLMLVAFFSAAFLGLGQYLYAGAISMPVLVLVGVLLFASVFGWRHDAIFWALVLALFVASLVSSLLRQRFTFLATGLLLVAVPFVAAAWFRFQGRSRHAMPLMVLMVVFYAIGLVSSLVGRSGFVPAVYTAIMSLKPFVLVGLGAALVWSRGTERGFEAIVRWAWLPFLVLGLLQWFAPSVYGAILSDPEATYDRNPFASQFPRALGPFNHPSVMATMAGAFAVFNVAYAAVDQRQVLRRLLTALAYLLVIVLTGQRQEFGAALVMLPVVYALVRWRPTFSAVTIVSLLSVVAVGALLWVVIPDNVERELQNWGFIDGGYGDVSPRSVLYADSIVLAARAFPLGTGFGTFASVGSIRFDQSLFVELGYGAFWWYTHRSFLYDSFWSRYIAETGWFGFAAQVLFYAVAARAVVNWLRDRAVVSDPALFRRAVLAASGLLLVLLISPTSNLLAEAHGSMFPLIYVGVAWRQIVQARAERAAVAPPAGLSTRPRTLVDGAGRA